MKKVAPTTFVCLLVCLLGCAVSTHDSDGDSEGPFDLTITPLDRNAFRIELQTYGCELPKIDISLFELGWSSGASVIVYFHSLDKQDRVWLRQNGLLYSGRTPQVLLSDVVEQRLHYESVPPDTLLKIDVPFYNLLVGIDSVVVDEMRARGILFSLHIELRLDDRMWIGAKSNWTPLGESLGDRAKESLGSGLD